MLKKFLFITLIFFCSLFILNIAYASDVVMDLDTNSAVEDTNTIQEDANLNEQSQDFDDSYSSITSTDYEDSTELSISNIINIILIAVGIVLILLGIAIILKLK